MKLHQHKERMKKMKPKDLIPKEVMLEARNVVFSLPHASYEEKLRKIDERVYGSGKFPQVVNPRHISMALDEALKTF
jgi:hypothetical protein